MSSGPLLQKLKWLFLPVAHLNLFVLKKNRMAVLKEKVYPVPKVGAVEVLTQVALKQNKNNAIQLIQSLYNEVIVSTVPSPGQSSLKEL